MMKRTRFIYGSINSPYFVSNESRLLLEHVIAMYPEKASRIPDHVVFSIPPCSTTRPLSHEIRIKVENRPFQIHTTEVVESKQFKLDFAHSKRGEDTFSQVTVYHESYTSNQSLLQENANFYRVDSYTDNMQYGTVVNGQWITFESGYIWSAPIFDVDSPKKLVFPKQMGYLTGTIEGEFVDVENIEKLLLFSLPGLYLPPPQPR
ncbi:hypothetical protein EBT25_01805 [bacterium]|jgi:hypothetical protein|nr:hypothetical protein [bacterium]